MVQVLSINHRHHVNVKESSHKENILWRNVAFYLCGRGTKRTSTSSMNKWCYNIKKNTRSSRSDTYTKWGPANKMWSTMCRRTWFFFFIFFKSSDGSFTKVNNFWTRSPLLYVTLMALFELTKAFATSAIKLVLMTCHWWRMCITPPSVARFTFNY